MEYSVSDLLRILLKKWYIILLTMALFAGLNLVLSNLSYRNAQRQYDNLQEKKQEALEQLTEEDTDHPVDISTYRVQYAITVSDPETFAAMLSAQGLFYQSILDAYDDDAMDALETYLSVDALKSAYQDANSGFLALCSDTDVLDACSDDLGQAADYAQSHLSFSAGDQMTFTVSITELQPEEADALYDAFCTRLIQQAEKKLGLAVELSKLSSKHEMVVPVIPHPENQTTADFIDEAVAVPEKPSISVRRMGMAVLGGFMFSCFGILLYTFVQDQKRQNVQAADE